MAAEAAMRAGAGYVTACVPASLNLIFEVRLLEVMSVPLPDTDGALGLDAKDVVLTRAERVQSLVLGPGLGRADETLEFAREPAHAAPVAAPARRRRAQRPRRRAGFARPARRRRRC